MPSPDTAALANSSCQPSESIEIQDEQPGQTIEESAAFDSPKPETLYPYGSPNTFECTHNMKNWESYEQKKAEVALRRERSPLRLLDLPIDILREIIKEVTHTNDLTSLALTHSALHRISIPFIYSRFDIVWPEAQVATDTRTGVDALTYGLSTLVMSEDVFADSKSCDREETPVFTCGHCGKQNEPLMRYRCEDVKIRRKRKGNSFARHTRKFSLGNGPQEWVQEYLISKESGKMLGTLVALALAKMANLETFIWDMPTGILRDVWFALSSLGDGREGPDSKLERVWVRCHDNLSVGNGSSSQPSNAQPFSQTSLPLGVTQNPTSQLPSMTPNAGDGALFSTVLGKSYRKVEHPSFSILPPLKSITVLNIDELAYLNELSTLIECSVNRLRELRLGMSSFRHARHWLQMGRNTNSQSSLNDSSMDYIAAGGVLGMVMSKLYDCRIQKKAPNNYVREPQITRQADAELATDDATAILPMTTSQQPPPGSFSISLNATIGNIQQPGPQMLSTAPFPNSMSPLLNSVEGDPENVKPSVNSLSKASYSEVQSPTDGTHELSASSLLWQGPNVVTSNVGQSEPPAIDIPPPRKGSADATVAAKSTSFINQRKLKLEVLELEQVQISVSIMQKTIDWTILTSLTLLNCEVDEELWKALRRTYSSRPNETSHSSQPQGASVRMAQFQPNVTVTASRPGYALRLKKIHTNNVSPALIAFLKETLAPNSLEWMFLQDRGHSPSRVTVDAIFRGPLRRHRASLTKVVIDSEEKKRESSSRNQKWRKWVVNRDILTFITSGTMILLRELAVAIDYKDWHFFLQRLPQIPHLRSLFVPHIADHVHGLQFDAKEYAMQVIDIITLRPEVELCYLGISTKCFEILENRHNDDSAIPSNDTNVASANVGPGGLVLGDADADEESDIDDDDNVDDDDDENDEQAAAATANEAEGNESEPADLSDTNSDAEEHDLHGGRKQPKLRLREILFYDDKVSIFKARHCQL